MSASVKRDPLPPYLAGTLLLRGSARKSLTAGLIFAQVVAGMAFQIAFDHHSNAVVAPVAIVLAWMWGRELGGAYGTLVTLANAAVATALGLSIGAWAILVMDAAVIGAVSFFVGHVGSVLERALGERARADEARDESEANARARMLKITDRVPIGLYRTTKDGRIMGGNEALTTILGFQDEESMLNTNVWDHYVDPEDRLRKIGRFADGDPDWHEFQLKRTDGTIIWVRDWAVAVRDAEGELRHFDGVLEDITQKHLADELFRAAFEDSPYGMAISTADGILIRGNAAVAELFRQPLEELSNIHFSRFTFEEDMDITPDALRRAEAGEVVRYEKRLRRSDGTHFWALVSLAPIRDAAEPQLFISHVIDITEKQEVREGLENLVRSKDELIASVSHELRTPLTVVRGLAEELDANWLSFSVPEQKEFIGLIAQQSAEVAYIVEDLLVAARADIGKLPIIASQVDVRDQIDAALASVPDLKPELIHEGITPPVAFSDPTRVRQIVRNLLANAVRYGGPDVRVRYGTDDAMVWLEVLDNGSGVSQSDAATIFEPYKRAHNAAGQPMSVGLGLTVSRTLAEMMGGSLGYHYDGSWSVFRLELPVPGAVHGGRERRSAGRIGR